MDIQTPALLLDEQKCRQNLALMNERARRHHLQFRPHFKTHQSRDIGQWFRRVGIKKITVSSVDMAQYFADEGWDDITIAFPVNPREAARYNLLAHTIRLNLLATDAEALRHTLPLLQHRAGIFIKIDTGATRTGLRPDDFAGQAELLSLIESSATLEFRGFLTHAGHAYRARDKDGIRAIHRQSLEHMAVAAEHWRSQYPELIVSVGDTPTCSVATEWEGVHEIRPGNFITYDLMQVQIGSCTLDQIGIAKACPVVARHRERSEIVIYGGAVHLSKEYIELDGRSALDEWLDLPKGTRLYGLPVLLDEKRKWRLPDRGSYVRSLSQEHGVVVATPELFASVRPGDLLGILPVHSCLTIDLCEQLYTTSGKRLDKM